MKKIFLIYTLLHLLISTSVSAQTPNFLWTKPAGGYLNDNDAGIAADPSGNAIAVGNFVSTTINFGTVTLTNMAHGDDIYIVKYDPSGNVIWAKSAGGVDEDVVNSICTDASGNIFITGYFNSPSIIFGTDTLNRIDAGDEDMFIAKYNPTGNVLWVKVFGGSIDDFSQSITTDPSGNVVITGRYDSPTIIFGSTTLTNTNGYNDIFLVKFNTFGNVLWAKTAGGTSDEFPQSVSTDAASSVIVTGYFESPVINSWGTPLHDSAGTFQNIFIVKYSLTGAVLWAKAVGGPNWSLASSVCTDASNNVFITGTFTGATITFGSSTVLTNWGPVHSDAFFLAKYDTGGNLVWAKTVSGSCYATNITKDASGNILVSGNADSTTFGTTLLGAPCIFYVKYNTSGNVVWATSITGDYSVWGSVMAVDPSGNIFATGSYNGYTLTVGTTNYGNNGSDDTFVLKLDEITGIPEISGDDTALQIYPNPTTGIFSVAFNESISKIEIINMLGETVYLTNLIHSNVPNQKADLDLSGQAKGIYFVKAENEKGIMIKKVIYQ